MATEVKSNKDLKGYEIFSLVSFRSGVDLFKYIQEKGCIVFGASGEMGHAISATFPRASIPILMQDIDKEKLLESKKNALEVLEKAAKKRKLSEKQLKLINHKGLIDEVIAFPEKGYIPSPKIDGEYAKSPEAAHDYVFNFLDNVLGYDIKVRTNYSNSFMVLEAGPENLTFKQNIFRFFELALMSEKAILSTNTSSLKVEDIANKIVHKERAVGFHYFLPAHINPLIEIIVSPQTSTEVVQAMQNLAISMGKKPIICFGDSHGAIANRILVGVLNEAAKIFDEGGDIELIDKCFLEVFYPKQINIQTKKAKRQFQAAPKLGFFKDEIKLYEKLKEKDITPEKKKEIFEMWEGRLRQKVLYAQIVENLESLGSFFKSAPCVSKLKLQATEQIKKIRSLINDKNINIEPYKFPKQEKSDFISEEIIKDRLQGAYITISMQIFNEGLGTIQDIELACKEGFKWNIGPFELINKLGKEKVNYLTELVNKGLKGKTGICNSKEITSINENDLSGVQIYIQDYIGFITLGRLHIQNLVQTQNSLGPNTLKGIQNALKELVSKNVKAIIFKSQGGGPFSSGADLDYIESTNWDTDKILSFRNLGKKTMEEISNCKIPTVALIDGPAVGGGAELTLACDYRIMTDLSYISFPEVGLGIIPDWGGTEKLPALVGKELAKRMICLSTLQNLGLKLGAEDAYETGFADAFVLQSELPNFLADVIEGKIKSLNIYKKTEIKTNYNKNDYSEHITKRFNLNKPFKHKFRIITRSAACLAEKLINNSHDTNYAQKVNDDETFKRLIKTGKLVSNIYIKPFIKAAQSSFFAPILEKARIL